MILTYTDKLSQEIRAYMQHSDPVYLYLTSSADNEILDQLTEDKPSRYWAEIKEWFASDDYGFITVDGRRFNSPSKLANKKAGRKPVKRTVRIGDTIAIQTNGAQYLFNVSDITDDGFRGSLIVDIDLSDIEPIEY